MCEDRSVTIRCKACKPERMKEKGWHSGDWDQDEHVISFNMDDFRYALFKSLNLPRFRCPQCGWKVEANINDENDDEWYCRCFSTKIAGERFTFCALALLCENCFHVEYYRPAVEFKCAGSGKEFRIYPSTKECCANGCFPILSAQKERMKQWQLQGQRLQNRLRKRKKG